MDLSANQEVTIEKFNGLWKRGIADTCPPDHAICCQNVKFPGPGNVETRDGLAISLSLPWNVKKQYQATYNNPNLAQALITLDDNGNLYAGTNPIPIYSNPAMYDFHLINLFGRVYIIPITDQLPSPSLLVWDGINPVRKAAGYPPVSAPTAANGSSGNIDAGDHQFAVCFVTNTGFLSRYGPAVTWTADGSHAVSLTNIPIGGPEVVQRVIVATRANELEFFFIPGGTIDDNTTTSWPLDFFDTDLTASADYLADQLDEITCQDPVGTGAGMLLTYHARLVLVVGRIVRVSTAQQPEAFDNVNGYINIPLNSASNVAVSGFVERDILYISRIVGLLATQDNLDVPGSWDVVEIDGAASCYKDSIGTIVSAVSALGVSEEIVIANAEGLFLFNGTVQRPELSWKIKNIWDTINQQSQRNINVIIDYIQKIIHVLLPVNNSSIPNLMLSCDYSEGIDYQSVKWTYQFFPFKPYSIGMAEFPDVDGIPDAKYYLRLGFSDTNGVFKLTPNATDDDGDAIDSRYCSHLAYIVQGAVNVFRAIQFRVKGSGILLLRLNSQDFSTTLEQEPQGFAVPLNPAQDMTRQINFVNEKMAVEIRVNAVGHKFSLQRIDIYGNQLWLTRPQ